MILVNDKIILGLRVDKIGRVYRNLFISDNYYESNKQQQMIKLLTIISNFGTSTRKLSK